MQFICEDNLFLMSLTGNYCEELKEVGGETLTDVPSRIITLRRLHHKQTKKRHKTTTKTQNTIHC